MGRYNSSITRVRPVFERLLERASSGRPWLPRLLKLATDNQEYARLLATRCSALLPWVVERRPYKDEELGREIDLEKCFEPQVPPSERFLAWLVHHPSEVTWPRIKGSEVKKAYGAPAQRWRRRLFGAEGPKAAEAARDEALKQLARRGALASKRQWWAFEGPSHLDCVLETNELVLVIEGKRTESLSAATEWLPGRNQLMRNLEAAQMMANGKQYAAMLITESPVLFQEEWVQAGLPHLAPEERSFLMQHYLGCVTWQQVCAAVGIDYDELPNTVADVLPRKSGAE